MEPALEPPMTTPSRPRRRSSAANSVPDQDVEQAQLVAAGEHHRGSVAQPLQGLGQVGVTALAYVKVSRCCTSSRPKDSS